MEQLIHFSEQPLATVRSVEQFDLIGDGGWFKPHGLWFSVEGNDDGWKAWCEGEGFRLQSLAHQTEIVLAENANILRLSTDSEIDAFTKKWRAPAPFGLNDKFTYIMNWPEIAKLYDGIIIAPYCWERRHSPWTFWYYAWDCASGCIWNASAIGELRTVPSEIVQAEIKEKVND